MTRIARLLATAAALAVAVAGVASPAGAARAAEADPRAPAGGAGRPAWAGRGLVYPEVASLAKRLGGDPARLLRFVAEEIGYEPYQGALRGARGTLLAGAGNAADKALLLRDLLRLSDPGAELRFAFATLPADQAHALAAGAAARRPPGPAATPAGATDRAAPTDPADREVSDEADRLLASARASWRELEQAVRRDASTLETALRQGGVALGSPVVPEAERVAAARAHVWLQVRRGGEWLDLDPTLDAASPGRRRAPPERTAAELSEALYHRVAINVYVEERGATGPATRYLLTSGWRAADLVGSTITYGHLEPLGLGTLVADTPPPPPGTQRYTPFLLIDDEYGLGEPFLLPTSGEAPAGGPLAGGGVLGRRIGDLFGGGIGGRGRPAPAAAAADQGPAVTGLWLEFVVATPDGKVEVVSRPILDRVGYAARAAGTAAAAPLAPLEESEGFHRPLLGVLSIATWTGEETLPPLVEIGLEPEAGEASGAPDLRAAFEALGAYHRAYYAARRALYAAVAPAGAPRFVPAGANLSVLAATGSTAGPDDLQVSLDLVRSKVVALPAAGSPAAAAAGVLWGVAALHAERFVLLSRSLDDPAAAGGSRGLADVAAVFDRARRDRVPLLLLRPEDAARAKTIAVSDEARARLQGRLAEGRTVLVPERPVPVTGRPRVGWWLIDPGAGLVLDEMEGGGHTAVEQPATTRQSERTTAAVGNPWRRRFEKGVRVVACTVHTILAGQAVIVQDMDAAIEHAKKAAECLIDRRGKGSEAPGGPRRPRRDTGYEPGSSNLPGLPSPPRAPRGGGPSFPRPPGTIDPGGWNPRLPSGRWPPTLPRGGLPGGGRGRLVDG